MSELTDEEAAKVPWCYACWCNFNTVSISSRHLYPTQLEELEELEEIEVDNTCSCPAIIMVSGYCGDEDGLKGPFRHMPTFFGVKHAERKPHKKEIKEAYSEAFRSRGMDRVVFTRPTSSDVSNGATPSRRSAAPSEDFTAQSRDIVVPSGDVQDPFNAPDREALLRASREALIQPRKSKEKTGTKSLKPLPDESAGTPARFPQSPAAKRATRSVPNSWRQTIKAPENKDYPFCSLSPRNIFSEMLSAVRRQSGERYKTILEEDETALFESLRAFVLPRAWEVLLSEDYSLSK